MPRVRKRKSTRGMWSEVAMAHAIRKVHSGRMKLLTAAKEFGVPRNTLRRKAENVEEDNRGPQAYQRDSALGYENEKNLVKHILKSQDIEFGLTLSQLRETAFKFAEKNEIQTKFNAEKGTAGYDWAMGFLSRHPELSLRKAEAISYGRAMCLNRNKID